MAGDNSVGLVSYAVQSKGPVPSGLMLEGGAHLAGRLLHEGYSPTVYDFNNAESIRRIAEEGKERFLDYVIDYLHSEVGAKGIKVLGFTLYTNGFKDNIKIAEELKRRNPKLMTAAGGPLVGWVEDEILRYTDAFDILVYGEGDEAIVRLADMAYRDGSISDVPGAIYRSGGQISRNMKGVTDISKLPFPAYDPEVYPFIGDKIHVSTLRTTTGCRYGRCNFCVQPRIDGRYRERSIDDVLAEVEHLGKMYGIRNFRLSDPNPSPRQLRALFEGLPEDVKISCFAYSDQEYDFSAARKNLIGLFMGVESMDPDTLLYLRKTRDPKEYITQCREMIDEAKRYGIATVYANIVPVPNDTSERIERDLERVLELQPDFITALPLAPMPRTIAHRQAVKYGDKSGIRLSKNFVRDLMLYELDLLAPPKSWFTLPWKLRVDKKLVNPLAVMDKFARDLGEHDICMASDEIVLMAHLYNRELNSSQEDRRSEVNEFQSTLRDCILSSDYDTLKDILSRIKQI